MINPEWAWAAGLFEGEGSVSRRRYGFTITIGMTDQDVLQRFRQAIGCGKIYGPYGYVSTTSRRRDHHKQYWRWNVSDRMGIERFMDRVAPMLMTRRQEQLRPVLDYLAQAGRARSSSCFDN